MTIPQLERLAKPYGCHIKRQGPLIAIQNASYSETAYIEYLPSKRPQDIVPILERVSGKKTAELWNGGKGGQA